MIMAWLGVGDTRKSDATLKHRNMVMILILVFCEGQMILGYYSPLRL